MNKPIAFASLIMASAVTILVACQPSHRPQQGREQARGTGDGGGGNTCAGRPIESYNYDVKASPAFQKHLAEYMRAIDARGDDFTRFLNHGLNKKWYLLPCELNKLPAEKISSGVKVEQAALQTFSEVWLNQQIFNAMSEKDQADLIAHEMWMALRLLKFDSPINQCKAFAPKVSYCDGMSDKRLGSPRDLTPQDYESIRKTTLEFRGLPPDSPYRAVEDLFARNGFDFGFRTFNRDEDYIKLSRKEFVQSLREASLTGRMPSVGEKGEGCKVNLALPQNDGDKLTVRMERAKGTPLEVSVQLPETAEFFPASENGTRVQKTSLAPSMNEMSVGERRLQLRIALDGPYLRQVEIYEMVCVEVFEDDPKRCRSMVSAADGEQFICRSAN